MSKKGGVLKQQPSKKSEMPKLEINPDFTAELKRQFEESLKIGAASMKINVLTGQSKPRF